ncbi:MAG: protein kinase [Parachlamydiales bacterium]|jgi:serine/threonine protein kinase
MTGITPSASSATPLVYGSIQAKGPKQKMVVVMKDHHNNLIASGEIISRANYITKSHKEYYREILIVDDNKKFSKAYIKIGTIKAFQDTFKSIISKGILNKKDSQDAFFRSVMQHQGIDKFEQLNKLGMQIAISAGPKGEKSFTNYRLGKDQIFEVVSTIEKNKDTWIQEANAKGHWVKKTFNVSDPVWGEVKITVEIFPKTRQRLGDLGQIDIKMKHLGKGSLKNVHESFNYEKNKLHAGLYAKIDTDSTRTEEEIQAQTELIASFQAPDNKPHTKTTFAISKAVDVTHVIKPNKIYGKVKFTQPVFKAGSLSQVLSNGYLPNGQPLDSGIIKQFYIDVLISLSHMEKIGRVHRDVKDENIQVEYSKKLGRYVAKLADFDLSTKKNYDENASGTPAYAAPEIILVEGFDGRADLYSLGKVMSQQADPWWQKNADTGEWSIDFDKLIRIRSENTTPYKEPADHNSYPWFAWKMTHPDPNMRFQSAAEALSYYEKLPDPMAAGIDISAESQLEGNMEFWEQGDIPPEPEYTTYESQDEFVDDAVDEQNKTTQSESNISNKPLKEPEPRRNSMNF